MTPAESLQRLAQSGAELWDALYAGDLAATGESLKRWQSAAEALREVLQTARLGPGEIEQLGELVRQGERLSQALVARRATARALLSELEAERLRLSSLAAEQPAGSRLSVSG